MIYTGYKTNLEILKHCKPRGARRDTSDLLELPLAMPDSANCFAHSAPSASPETIRQLELLGARRRPFDLVIPSQKAKRHIKNFRQRIISAALPPKSFAAFTSELSISMPELLFLQMASCSNGEFSDIKLIMLGFELCGGYTVFTDENGQPHMEQRAPLTHKSNISDYIDCCQLLNPNPRSAPRGIARARLALRHVLDNSASPMESKLVCLLCLPERLGGYGITQPSLNYPVEIGRGAQEATGKDHLVCDLFWQEANLDVEYDSNAHHAGAEQLQADSSRRAALRDSGIDVITATSRQVLNVAETDLLAKQIKKALRRSQDYGKHYDFETRKLKLRAELFPKTDAEEQPA